MSLFAQVSVPIMTSGAVVSISTSSSAVLFRIDWKFTMMVRSPFRWCLAVPDVLAYLSMSLSRKDALSMRLLRKPELSINICRESLYVINVAFCYEKNNPARRAGEKIILLRFCPKKSSRPGPKNSKPPLKIKWTVPKCPLSACHILRLSKCGKGVQLGNKFMSCCNIKSMD